MFNTSIVYKTIT